MATSSSARVFNKEFSPAPAFPATNESESNVGTLDAILRGALGAVALGSIFAVRSRWAVAALGAVAASSFKTATSRYCPANQMFGINTTRR